MNRPLLPDDQFTEGPDAAGARGDTRAGRARMRRGLPVADQGELCGGLALFASRGDGFRFRRRLLRRAGVRRLAAACAVRPYRFSSASRRATRAAVRASSTPASASPATLE